MNKDLLLQQANQYLDRKDYISAETCAKRIPDFENNNKAVKILCRIAAGCERIEKAKSYLDKYKESEDRDYGFMLFMGEFFCSESRPDIATGTIRRVASVFPNVPAVRKKLEQYSYLAADMDIFPTDNFIKDPASPTGPENSLLFHIITVVFGKEFTTRFVEDVMPTQLGPDNIEALNRGSRSLYVIYTTPEDALQIKAAPIFQKFVDTMDVRIHCVNPDFMNPHNKYELMILCHRHAVRKGHACGARIVFLAPDAIFSDSTFRNLYKRALEGYRAVMIGTLRVTKEDFLPRFRRLFPVSQESEAPVPARELVALALQHLHPDTRNSLLNAPTANGWPSQILCEVPGEGILARNFHLHPLMIHPETINDFQGTVDDDCVGKLCQSMEEVYVVHDSDEMTGFDFSAHSTRAPERENSLDTGYVAAWAEDHADHFHWEFLKHELYIHNGTRSEKRIRAAKELRSTIKDIKNFRREGMEHIFPPVLEDSDLRYPPMYMDYVHFSPAKDSAATLRKISELAHNGGVRQLNIGFRPGFLAAGDTLEMAGWERDYAALQGKFSKLNISCPLHRELNGKQCRTLSIFDEIAIFISHCKKAPDMETELEKILVNMEMIRNSRPDNNSPRFHWLIPLSMSTPFKMDLITARAAAAGVAIISWEDAPILSNGSEQQNQLSIRDGKLSNILESLEFAKAISKSSQLTMELPRYWEDSLRSIQAKLEAENEFGITLDISTTQLSAGPEIDFPVGKGRFQVPVGSEPVAGETRCCTTPWNEMWINGNGDIRTCPLRRQRMGNIHEIQSLRAALHTREFNSLRRQLVTGDVSDRECLHCPLKERIPHRTLKKIVADMIRANMHRP